MILAHTLYAGGPDLEMLLIAGALLVLGIVLFMQRSASPKLTVGLMLGAVAIGAGAFAVSGQSSAAPPAGVGVEITAPFDGEEVDADKRVPLEVAVRGGELTAATQSDDPTQGHLHVYVNETLVDMPTSSTSTVKLGEGAHTITVEFTTADHRSFEPAITDAVTVVAK